MQENNYRGENLIFIISQPRSGSTLLQRILAGHPDILASAETWLMLHPLYIHKHEDIKTPYNSEWASIGVSEFIDNYTDAPEILDEANRRWAETIYGNALNKANKAYFLDKTPRYYFIITDLYRLFPKARFIFLLRNPMAVLASEFNTYVKDNWAFLSALAPDLLSAPNLILQGIKALGADAIVLHYEQFVTNPEQNISILCDRLGIEFNISMLDYSKTKAPEGSLNDPVGIHQHSKPGSHSVDKWKQMAADPQKRYMAEKYLEALGKNTIEQYGYDFDGIKKQLSVKNDDKSVTKNLFPWSIAITPRNEWTFKQKLRASDYNSIKEKGAIFGRIESVKKLFKHLTAKFK
jgi:hypothetical protein